MLKLLLVALLLNSAVWAQLRQLSGTVKDSKTGAPLAAASVNLIGRNNGTVTDNDGKFVLGVPAGNSTIEISYIGFVKKTSRCTQWRQQPCYQS